MINPLDMSGKVVLVTGGTRGVGRGITDGFLRAGADVVICGRSAPEDMPAAGGREAMFVAGDVRDAEQVDAIVSAAVERFGRLDVAVNNAGGAPPADAATASPRYSASIINLNLLAPLLVAQRANAVMQGQAEGGLIVSITSVSALRPSPNTAAYGAAKAGVISLTQSLAVEWAPKVRVNCVTAGPIGTKEYHAAYGGDAYFEAVGKTIPLGRIGQPDDVANACLFLASPLASWVTGSNLVVHGGGDQPVEAIEGGA